MSAGTPTQGTDLGVRKRRAMRFGAAVFAGLIVLDTVEYLVAQVAGQLLLWMTILALPQVVLIAVFYMHVRQLRRTGGR